MKIAAVEAVPLAARLRVPFRFGNVVRTTSANVLVRITGTRRLLALDCDFSKGVHRTRQVEGLVGDDTSALLAGSRRIFGSR